MRIILTVVLDVDVSKFDKEAPGSAPATAITNRVASDVILDIEDGILKHCGRVETSSVTHLPSEMS